MWFCESQIGHILARIPFCGRMPPTKKRIPDSIAEVLLLQYCYIILYLFSRITLPQYRVPNELHLESGIYAIHNTTFFLPLNKVLRGL